MSLDVEALYQGHHRAIRGFVANRLRGVDDAAIEDLAADVWERVVRAAPSYRDRGVSPKAWLYRIAQNLLVDRYREHGRKVAILRLGTLKPYVEHVGTPDHIARIDARVDVGDAMTRLTDAQRAVVAARFFEGRSTQQASAATGHTEHGVKKLQQRALVNLRRAVEAA